MSSYHDKEYKKLLNFVLSNGVKKGDRTNTGTISSFCPPRCSFDLSDGSIPLLTIKKMNTNAVIHELLWYISGNSNTTYLQDNNVKIWNEWADESNKDLGQVYGYLWRSFPPVDSLQLVKKKSLLPPTLPNTNFIDCTFNDLNNGHQDKILFNNIRDIWLELTSNDKNIICDVWCDLSNFYYDVKKLPNFIEYTRNPKQYTLSEKYFSSANQYFHPELCVWVKKKHHIIYCYNTNAYVCNDGKHYTFFNHIDELANHLDAEVLFVDAPKAILFGKYEVTTLDENSDYVVRYPLHVDQLQDVIQQIKTNPNSRRHVITAWHPSLLPSENNVPNENPFLGKQALPACHFQMQFYVRDGHLDLLLNMRSNDLFLGAPFNIVQYSILLHMVAHVTNLKPGTFYHNPADAHIYLNHLDQCNIILEREEYESPLIKLNPNITDITDFTFNDISIVNYNHHGFIKAPVAV